MSNSVCDRTQTLEARISGLPPEKRALFYQQLAQHQPLAQPGAIAPPTTIPRGDRPLDLPLSIAQEQLWFWQQLYPQDAAYNIAITWAIAGPLDVPRLEAGLNAVVQRHEPLRTYFATQAGVARQVVLPELFVPIVRHSLAADLPIDAHPDWAERQASAIGQADAQRPFDLAQAPLFRATLVATGPQSWQLFLTLHHSIADGWSRGLLLQEMASAYWDLAAYQGRSPLALHYADYAIWQRQWLQTEAAAAAQAYWRQQLAGLEPLQLPSDRPRQLSANFAAATVSRQWSADFLQQLKAFSQRSQTTLFTTLLAGFQILLHHQTGQTDIAVGVPVANRELPELRDLIGFFVNTLVLRQDLAAALAEPLPGKLAMQEGFQSWVKRTQATIAAGFEHQSYPFAKVVEQSQPDRDRRENPLFQVMFQLQNAAYQAQNAEVIDFGRAAGDANAQPDLHVEQTWRALGSTKFDLTWHGIEQASGLLWVVEYRTEKFTAAAIAAWLDQLEVLLQSALADATKPISQLNYLPEAQRQQLIAWGDGGDRPGDSPPLNAGSHLLERVRAVAQRTPDAIALTYQAQRVTYGELLGRSQQLSQQLRSQLDQQARPAQGWLIGLQMPRSIELMVAILAVWQAGAAYLPLDQTLPEARSQYILDDAQPALVLTQADVSRWAASSSISGPASEPDQPIHPDDLAYVIYTSGSTGQPKGALLTHSGLNNYLAWCEQAYPLDQGCGAPVQSAIGFDATITSLFAPLLVGKTVHLLPEGDDLAALQAIVQAPQPFSFAKVTPAHLEILAALPARSYPHAFVIGGEALTPALVQKWQAIAPQTRLFNEYGPTETVVGCCVAEVQAGPTVPIGRPIPGVQLYVLDAQQQRVPVGVAGELYIGGVGVGRGYLNRAELTAAAFIANPFGPGQLYRSGDRVQWQRDGQLAYLGRLDRQVKLRGYRIELGEIEAAMLQYPLVEQALVTTLGVERAQLVAYYVVSKASVRPGDVNPGDVNPGDVNPGDVNPGGVNPGDVNPGGVNPEPENQPLRAFLSARLPHYMLPSHLIALDAMPLTENGKVDRAALPQPTPQRDGAAFGAAFGAEIGAELGEPSGLELALLDVWQELLGRSVQRRDNFFELGGDSILALQMVAKAQMQGIHLTPQQLFEHQTIAQLAAAIPHQQPLPAIPEVQTPLPLTPIQQWFFVQNLHDWHHYHQVLELPVLAGLDATWLNAAMQQLRAQHGALRLRFFQSQGQWQQQIIPATDARWAAPVVDEQDLRGLDPQAQTAAMGAIAQARSADLDPTSGDLLRVLLFRLGEFDRLVLVVHHLAIDGMSWRILLGDLALLYRQQPLPPPTTPFSAWVDQLTQAANSPPIQQQLPHWIQARRPPAASIEPLREATSETVSEIPGETLADEWHHTVRLEAATTRQLFDLLQSQRHQGWRMEDLLLGAIVEGLSPLLGTRRLRVDLEQMGRDRGSEAADWSRTIGWFTSLYPVELDLSQVTEISEIVPTIHSQLNVPAIDGISYGLLRYLADLDDGDRQQLEAIPTSSVCFNYLGTLDLALPEFCDAARFDRSYLFQPMAVAQSPRNQRLPQLKINAYRLGGCLEFRWTCSQKTYSSDRISVYAESVLTAVQKIIDSRTFNAARLDQRKLKQFLRKIQS